MGSRKLIRDIFFLSNQRLSAQLQARQVANTRLRLGSTDGLLGSRRYSIFNEFSQKVKGAANSNPDFQQSIKDLKEKAGELKGVKEDLKVRTKQTTEQLYKRVDGVWTDAEATAKKVSANVKEKLSSATEEVKETLGLGKQERSQSSSHTTSSGADVKDGCDAKYGEDKPNTSESSDTVRSIFGRFKSTVSSASPKVVSAFQKLKDAKVIDLAKKGYDVVKDDLSSNPRRRHMQQESSSFTGERSTITDIVFVPTKQSRWEKKWEAFKDKMQDHPVFKRITKVSEPVVTKSHELAEDIRERWETSDHPVVHKIQDLNETVFRETDAALSFKEIRQRDPSFSLPEFIAEIQETIRPTLNAYFKGDVETLKKNCTPNLIERCKAESRAYKSNGIFFDNKILHVSELEIKETKLMESSPVIVIAFTTQQVHCVRDSQGSITEGGKDTIHTVLYYWAMKQVDVEELGEGALYSIWRLNEMQQVGAFQALI